jgi:hypothetical protein
MTRPRNVAAALAALGFALTAAADDDDRDRSFKARLSGFNEVHFSAGPPPTLRGAVSTKARGTFRATLDRRSDLIHYKLSYEGLEGAITQAHIHFGQHHTVGGITVWLCQTAGTPAPGAVAALTPQCVAEGTVSGTITPAQVLAAAGQGLEAGEFGELVRAMRAGATYANVHSALFPPGEIRGQIRGDDD